MRAKPAVAVEDLHKIYANGIEAVRGLWFEVAEGEIFGLLGPNGAGKSTTLGVLTTVVRHTRGRAAVAGYDVRRQPREVRRRIGVVFQEAVLDNEFSGRENLRLHARLWGVSRHHSETRIDELLALMGIAGRADDNVRSYSGGMRRRLEIARALLAGPRVVFLDEPTVGLDPSIRDAIWRLIEQLRRDEGVTVVLSTHYLEEAEGVCDRVGIIDHGRLVAQGRPVGLVEQLGKELVELRVDGDADRGAAALAALGMTTRAPLVRNDTVTLPLPAGAEALRSRIGEAADGLGIRASTVRRSTLADVFAHLTAASVGPEGEPEGEPQGEEASV
jgi:ABC-2 type transport system ATP-binding protein